MDLKLVTFIKPGTYKHYGEENLIIEDEPVITEMIRFILEREGFEVKAFSNKAGVMEAVDQSVALVLLDLMLGAQDGLGICEQMKTSGKPVPVILISAHRDLEKIATECGADGFIGKPFELNGFAARIKGFIR